MRPVKKTKSSLLAPLALLLAACVCAAALALVVAWGADQRVTILVMGADLRPGDSGPGNTDTLMLLTVDPAKGDAAMLSIPRDLYVEIPGYGQGRINTAYALGEQYDEPGGGPGLAMRTIEQVFGIPVDHWAVMRFDAVQQAVDLVGGVDVDVPYDIYDPAYPTPDYGTEVFALSAGPQHMDGATALKYMRTRHQDSDFGRMARQRQVLMALKDRLASPAAFAALLPRLPGFVVSAHQDLASDLTPLRMLGLAWNLTRVGPSRFRSLSIDPAALSDWTTPDGAQVLLPSDTARINATVQEFLAAP